MAAVETFSTRNGKSAFSTKRQVSIVAYSRCRIGSCFAAAGAYDAEYRR